METLAIVLVVVAATAAIRVSAGVLDGDRISRYFAARGCRLLSRRWTPFGAGWFGELSCRIYLVEFEDADGWRRRATVETSLWTGVFLTEETIVAEAPPPPGSSAS